jgi:IS1 family transposase
MACRTPPTIRSVMIIASNVVRRIPSGITTSYCVIENVRADTLTEFVREAVSHKVSLLCTDQWKGYKKLDKEYPHATIDHSKGQYVIGAVHTQTIEGFWSIFKRGVMGTFHKMSAKYMPLYVAEFQFRYNNRENVDIFGTAISGC